MKENFKHFQPEQPGKPDKQKTGEGGPEISRREFLKWSGGAALAGVLTLIPFEERSRAWSREVQEGSSWLEGIEALHDEAMYSENESVALYITDKNGTGAWETSTMGGTTQVIIYHETLKAELSKDPQKIIIAHTHPLKAFLGYGMSEDDIDEVQNSAGVLPSMPPSITDIKAAITTAHRFEDKNGGNTTRITHAVIDPRGIWEFSADVDHDFVKHFMLWIDLIKNSPHLLERDPIARRVWNKNSSITTPEMLIHHLFAHNMEELDPETQELVQETMEVERHLRANYGQDINDLSDHITRYTHQSSKEAAGDVEAVKAQYGKIGIKLSFKTLEELQ